MVWGQSREERINDLKQKTDVVGTRTTDTGTNTKSIDPIFLINTQQKKRPHDIIIKNNSKETKVNPNIKYSNKQNYRRYKTKKEPLLKNKITINEEDDIVNKIKEAFGLQENKQNTNLSRVETQQTNYIKIPSKVDEIPSTIKTSSNIDDIFRLKTDYYDDIDEISKSEKEQLTEMTYNDDYDKIEIFSNNLEKYMYETSHENSDLKQFFDYDHTTKRIKVKDHTLTDEEKKTFSKVYFDVNLDYRQVGDELLQAYSQIAQTRNKRKTTNLELVPYPSPSAPSLPATPKSRYSVEDINYLDHMNDFQNRLLRPNIPNELRFLSREDDSLIPFVPAKFRGRPPIRPEAISRRAQQQINIAKQMNKEQETKSFDVKRYNAMFDVELQKYLSR